MNSVTVVVTVLLIAASSHHTFADVSHILNQYETTTPIAGPPNPYIFSYTAGRAPGHVDRTHTEVSDGSGVVRGAFSYIDPRQQIRTVQYTADEYGFHPELSHKVEDTEANKLATQRHLELYNRIAQEHANPQPQYETKAAAPLDSPAVIRATNKHLSLYEKIAQEHAAIGAEHAAARKAFEATSEPNQLTEEQHYQQ